MGFDVSADAYDRFMGRFSEPLAARFAAYAGADSGRALDVGCGPGALTAVLVDRLGPASVSAVDPSPPFVEAARARFPGVDVRQGAAERLPFEDAGFDLCLAQLVVHFMSDPVAGLAEMARVTADGGVVAACVWDHAGVGSPLSPFWSAVRDLDPSATGEAQLAGTREGQLGELARAAGLTDVEESAVAAQVHFASFDDWWEPFTFGVGPAGDHVARLDEAGREALRRRCAAQLPPGPFTFEAVAWAVRATVRRPHPGRRGPGERQ